MTASKHEIEPRVCRGCPMDFGVDGPLPFLADQHVGPDGKLFTTCSPPCRVKLGLPERKASSR